MCVTRLGSCIMYSKSAIIVILSRLPFTPSVYSAMPTDLFHLSLKSLRRLGSRLSYTGLKPQKYNKNQGFYSLGS